MPLDWVISKPSKLVAYFGRTVAIFRPHEICIEENMVGTVAEQLIDFYNNCVQVLDVKLDAIMVANSGNIVCNFADAIQMVVLLRLPKQERMNHFSHLLLTVYHIYATLSRYSTKKRCFIASIFVFSISNSKPINAAAVPICLSPTIKSPILLDVCTIICH